MYTIKTIDLRPDKGLLELTNNNPNIILRADYTPVKKALKTLGDLEVLEVLFFLPTQIHAIRSKVVDTSKFITWKPHEGVLFIVRKS